MGRRIKYSKEKSPVYSGAPRGVNDGKRRMFTKFIKDRSVTMTTAFQAKRFVEGMLSYDSKLEMLSVLDDSRFLGRERLRDVMGYLDLSKDCVTTILLPILRSIVNDETNRPLNRKLRNRLVIFLFNIPYFMENLREISIDDDICGVYSLREILNFITCLAKTFVAGRQSTITRDIAIHCREKGVEGSIDLCNFLLTDVVDGKNSIDEDNHCKEDNNNEGLCWVTDFHPPGDRHSNDFFNFRDISIVPTLDELSCDTPPWLPLANGTNAIFQDFNIRLLDSNFRLLREDAIDTMKECMKDRRNIWTNTCVIDIDVGIKQKWSPLSFVVQLEMPTSRKIDWERSRCLPLGGIVAFLRNNALVKVGIISKRDCREEGKWLRANDGPNIGVVFDEIDSFHSSLNEVGLTMSLAKESIVKYEMIELSRSFFSYKPVLRALQNMSTVPFSSEIISYQSERLVSYLPSKIAFPNKAPFNGYIIDLLSVDLESIVNNTSLDISQAKAVRHALTSRVALIQGPPGTGKTFIGALIAGIIRDNSDATILCVCYTNHALDQFLEHLYENGEREIVRVGGRSKSDVIGRYRINELARTKMDLPRDAYFRLKDITRELELLYDEVNRYKEILKEPLRWESPVGGVKSLLGDNYPDFLEQLTLPTKVDEFQIVGRKNKMLHESYLFELWCKGGKCPDFLLDDPYNRDDLKSFALWGFSLERRKVLINSWREDFSAEIRTNLYAMAKRYNELFEEKQTIQQIKHRSIISDAKVIGATTTGAAMHRDILESCGADVVIIEEAGEVFESHILTSLSNETKHLIMIGDHLQLRPKPESYKLTCSSNYGFNLDRSLFERLITSNLPSCMLQVQHRMRPEISQIIRRQTYPTLQDHASVRLLKSVRAVSRNVIFINHLEQEDRNQSTSPTDNQKTKSNSYESKMVVEIARYFLLQGYKPSQIVILTPYVGQLLCITRDMKRNLSDIEAYVSEMDRRNMDDIDNEELGDNSCVKKENIRVAAIDNFQGEEADIVIISIVRSNNYGDVGFLKEKQRINVLFSRARLGMFVIGNASTLRESAKGAPVWEPLLNNLEKDGCIFPGLPTICENHKDDELVLLCQPCEFRTERPNGGCLRPCKFRMECGHTCPQACHFIDQSHKVAQTLCTEPCKRFPKECNNKHPCPKLCKDECGNCRTKMGPVQLLCGHIVESPYCHDVRNNEAIENLSARCNVPVLFKFNCGHEEVTSCSNTKSKEVCPAFCGIAMECGHKCKKRCGDCEGKHLCDMACERLLFCGHRCGRACHVGKECEPCSSECIVKCVHSTCAKRCSEVCASCVEPCDWQCEHQGKCTLVCGAPCSRLPCNMRCSKKLSCGHQCPSLCGEECPSQHFCAICGDSSIQNRVVDLITMERYKDVDLREDPIIILPCKHFFQTSSLDGIMEIREFYMMHSDNTFFRARFPSIDTYSGKPKTCPDCRNVIHSVFRYGRVLRFHEIRVLERKHNMILEQRLSRARTLHNLKKIETLSYSGPMMRVYEACGGNSQVEVKPPDHRLLIKIKLMICDKINETKDKSEGNNVKAEKYCIEAVELSRQGNCYRSLCESLLKLSLLLLENLQHSSEKMERIKAYLDEVLLFTQFDDLIERAERLRDALQVPIGSIINAVHEGYKSEGGYNYGGSWSDHWFECPNGHPYFIGECGRAMEISRCVECNEIVGGSQHLLQPSNAPAVPIRQMIDNGTDR